MQITVFEVFCSIFVGVIFYNAYPVVSLFIDYNLVLQEVISWIDTIVAVVAIGVAFLAFNLVEENKKILSTCLEVIKSKP